MAYFNFNWSTKEISFNINEIPYNVNAYWQKVYTVEASRLYAEWKEWAASWDNLKYPIAFDTIGGEDIGWWVKVGAYFFLRTDLWWIGIPPAEDCVIIVKWNLFPRVDWQVVISTLSDFPVTLMMQNSSLTQALATSWGWSSITAADIWSYYQRTLTESMQSSLTQAEHTKLMSIPTNPILDNDSRITEILNRVKKALSLSQFIWLK